MPQKTWVVGEEVLAADFNTYIQNQVVPTFPTTAARDAWAAPPNGALCVTTDTNTVWQRVAGAWVSAPVNVWFVATGGGDALPTGLTNITWPSTAGTAFTYDGPNKRLVCQAAGQYTLSARVIAATGSPVDVRILIGPSGDTYFAPTTSGAGNISTVRVLSVNDTVAVQMNNPGAATSTVAGGTRFEAVRLRI